MTVIDTKIDASTDFACPDSSAFLNWDGNSVDSEHERTVVFQSLVATVKIQAALDDSLEVKAVKFLTSVDPKTRSSADIFLSNFGQTTDESLTNFVQCIVVLISSPNRAITTTMMKIINSLINWCSPNIRLDLFKADLLPQLITTLNPLSLSFAEAVDIHTCLMKSVRDTLWPTTPESLASIKIEEWDEQQNVHGTVYQQVLAPSEQYIRHLCVNRFSIIDGDQSANFLLILGLLLRISPYYQPIMEFVMFMPVIPTIPSSLTIFEDDETIWDFLIEMIDTQREWNYQSGKVQKKGMIILRMLRMEGIEDAMEAKLHNNKNEFDGRWIVYYSIRWNNRQGMNLSKQE
ncbi:hypothetical protein BLNAU_12030 [Blattamonas nauphoetae]|uniref:Uncharacterized protein n=1 Tax=Blattamonas nauphoetae TaxID=2049346 RepID=A0ABQ9XLW6_9EUKA|nr:hypothetical protein BLNAU_12030 [Blattamonas nauphoetae]